MEKIIERNVPIAEENVTLSGQPATNMFEDWSENITETDLLHEEKDKGLSPKKNPKKLMKEMLLKLDYVREELAKFKAKA